MLFGYLFETRSRQHMDSLFGQYVPPDLVRAMSRDPENYSLASEKRELSVLFTDIRSFTTISEGLEADELSELMDEYLTPMTRIVHESQGTIDKYMGDAVMAFWNAPRETRDHELKAIRAMLDFQPIMADLNREFRAMGLPDIDIDFQADLVQSLQQCFARRGDGFEDKATNPVDRLAGDAHGLGLFEVEFCRNRTRVILLS